MEERICGKDELQSLRMEVERDLYADHSPVAEDSCMASCNLRM